MNITQLREKFIVTELERRLKSDRDGHVRDAILTELSKLVDSLTESKREALPPKEYETTERLLASARTAKRTVQRAWRIDQVS